MPSQTEPRPRFDGRNDAKLRQASQGVLVLHTTVRSECPRPYAVEFVPVQSAFEQQHHVVLRQ